MYSLTLTDDDFRAIDFSGYRYGWSDALGSLETGENQIPEHEAWEIAEAFEADTEGGHSPFPLLAEDSELYDKLRVFWDSIV